MMMTDFFFENVQTASEAQPLSCKVGAGGGGGEGFCVGVKLSEREANHLHLVAVFKMCGTVSSTYSVHAVVHNSNHCSFKAIGYYMYHQFNI
jgi:hypothetical protein